MHSARSILELRAHIATHLQTSPFMTSKSKIIIGAAILGVLLLVFAFAFHLVGFHAVLFTPLIALCLLMDTGADFWGEEAPAAELLDNMKKIKTGIEGTRQAQQEQAKEIEKVRAEVNRLQKARLETLVRGPRRPGQLVSEPCARHLSATLIVAAEFQGKLRSREDRDKLLNIAAHTFGMETKAALTTSDIPLPVEYGQEVIELMWKYGQARQYATVYPLATGSAKLPKLKTSPAFGFIDQSASVPEKSPQIEFVDFAAKKAGGLIRVPSEIDADSIVPLGNWLARYVAREFAKWEDTVAFLADGTATYKSISGVGKKADTIGYKVQLGAGKTAPSDIVISDLRTLRTKVDAAALASSAYYMHPTHEAFLNGLNTTTIKPYIPSGPNGPTLDGFPIRWIGVMPVYDTSAHASQYQISFGDLTYWFLGERGHPDLATSRDVFFATDEIALRGLERFDWQLMADAAMAVLQLGT